MKGKKKYLILAVVVIMGVFVAMAVINKPPVKETIGGYKGDIMMDGNIKIENNTILFDNKYFLKDKIILELVKHMYDFYPTRYKWNRREYSMLGHKIYKTIKDGILSEVYYIDDKISITHGDLKRLEKIING